VSGAILGALGYGLVAYAKASREARKARSLADNAKFDEALATAVKETIATMLRDRFGTVSLDALLADSVTRDQVFRSLKRLTELLNQPVPAADAHAEETPASAIAMAEAAAPPVAHAPGHAGQQANYVDLLDDAPRLSLAGRFASIADEAAVTIQESGVWTGLAGARRDLERAVESRLGVDAHRMLSPRIFWDPRLRAAMSNFLHIANRAIHGEEVTVEDAERALHELHLIAVVLPQAPARHA
jgi:hypothetical protein